jgi:hypothetical protein
MFIEIPAIPLAGDKTTSTQKRHWVRSKLISIQFSKPLTSGEIAHVAAAGEIYKIAGLRILSIITFRGLDTSTALPLRSWHFCARSSMRLN